MCVAEKYFFFLDISRSIDADFVKPGLDMLGHESRWVNVNGSAQLIDRYGAQYINSSFTVGVVLLAIE